MKLLYMGTGASEGVPAVFCDCPACRHARAAGGREVRSRSGALVDGVLKLDYPADAYMQALKHGVDLSKIDDILITHTHRDHFCPSELGNRFPPYCQKPASAPPLRVYGNIDGESRVETQKGVLEYNVLSPGDVRDIAGYRVTALRARHAPEQTALIYIIEKDGKALLYAHDTDCFAPEHFEAFVGKRFSIVSLDCTNGVLEASYEGHMGIRDNLLMREALTDMGAADGQTLFVANHFSHNGLKPFEDMQSALPGFIIAYDGLSIEV